MKLKKTTGGYVENTAPVDDEKRTDAKACVRCGKADWVWIDPQLGKVCGECVKLWA